MSTKNHRINCRGFGGCHHVHIVACNAIFDYRGYAATASLYKNIACALHKIKIILIFYTRQYSAVNLPVALVSICHDFSVYQQLLLLQWR